MWYARRQRRLQAQLCLAGIGFWLMASGFYKPGLQPWTWLTENAGGIQYAKMVTRGLHRHLRIAPPHVDVVAS